MENSFQQNGAVVYNAYKNNNNKTSALNSNITKVTALRLWANPLPLKNSEKIHTCVFLYAEQCLNGRLSAIS